MRSETPFCGGGEQDNEALLRTPDSNCSSRGKYWASRQVLQESVLAFKDGLAVVFTGGGVPVGDEVILNLGNMNNVRSFDPVAG